MTLEWLPRDNGSKNHILIGSEHWGTEAPCTVYEKKPLTNPKGEDIPGLYVAWIRLNNPNQYNSYTTEMVKGVIAGFTAASQDRSVIAVVFTGTGDKAFCTGGNTKETPSPRLHPSEQALLHGILRQIGWLDPSKFLPEDFDTWPVVLAVPVFVRCS